MNNTKFSKLAVIERPRLGQWIVENPDGKMIGSFNNSEDAELFTAAPDMYEALESYVSAIEFNRKKFNNVTLLEREYEEIFKAALLKANPNQ